MPKEIIEMFNVLNKSITVKEAEQKDSSVFVDLINKQYGRKKDKKYFDWMFVNYALPAKLITAYDNLNPIAFYGIQIKKLSNNTNCSISVDIIIDEKYRKRGIFNLLEKDAYNFALSNNASIMTVFGNLGGMKAHDRLGTWKTVAKIDTLIFDCKNNKLKTNINFTGNDDLKFVYYIKNDEYRKWRYDDNPVYEYKKVILREDVFAMIKLFEDTKDKTRYGDIVDIQCPTNDFSVLKDLFIKSFDTIKKDNVRLITVWALPHTNLFNLLIPLGFRIIPQERYFCSRVIDSNYKHLADINNWNLVEADSELY